jgi:integrase
MSVALKIVNRDETLDGKKDYINNLISKEPKTGVLFSDFITKTIIKKSKRLGENYQRNYKTLIHHLERFSDINEAILYTNSINEEFLDDFISYLQDQNLKMNYIKNLIMLVKAMARKAGSYGYAIDPTYDDVPVDEEAIFNVYLSSGEITRVYYFKGLTRKQQQIRDLFVVGCLTALRYSDYSTLTKSDFLRDCILKTTKKTNVKVIIPIHDYVREIYERYNGEIAHGLSNQHFNRYIKMICCKVGLNDPITFSYTRGGKLVTETKLKWELISSHTARRSAATNMLIHGMKPFQIMSITGHTTEKSFFRYIQITKEDISKQISGDNYFKK